jgi:diguanylate cyclase (GGDEF)-like protein/PAS domain S-box-containing protein
MNRPLRILHVEDSDDDAELILHALRASGCSIATRRVETESEYLAALTPAPDLILVDYYMPQFTAERALALLQARGLDVPIIIVSGHISADAAVALMKAGAHDYVLKDDLPRLWPAIRRELREARERAERRRAEAALRNSEAQLRLIMENAGDLIMMLDAEGRRLYASASYHSLFDDLEALRGSDSFAEVHPADRDRVRGVFQETVATGVGQRCEFRLALKDRGVRYIESQGSVILDDSGKVSRVVLVSRDVTERKRAEEALRESEERKSLAVRGARLGTWDWHIPSGKVVVNERATRMLGYAPNELAPHIEAWRKLMHPEDQPRVMDLLAAHLEGRSEFFEAELRLCARSGAWVWVLNSGRVFERDAAGAPLRAAGTHLDISDRKAAEAHVEYLAHHDGLTGLPNRALLSDFMTQALAMADRDGRCLAVLFIDLDHFKTINDSLGHQIGDKLLKQVAARLRRCERRSDVLARLGGDEFVMVLNGIKDARNAANVAAKIIAALARPYRAGNQVLNTSCSIGISIYPDDGQSVHALMKNADMAMYHAKERGRNHYQFFSQEMGARADERLRLGNALRQAMERDEFVVYYQPYVELASGHVTGVEALLRWRHPELGLLSPDRFIPLAEETGMIVTIGQWVLRTACEQMQTWRAAGIECPRVAVNLSARQFRQIGLAQQIAATLKKTGLEATALELEITESMAMQDPERTKELLHELRAMGIGLSIDDFGTGYSSLSYLKVFPIRCLKIDRSFVDGIPRDPNDAAITRATIALAKILGLHVIAEGVETQAQQSFLRDAGCEHGQGFLFAAPGPPSEIEPLLRQTRVSAAVV